MRPGAGAEHAGWGAESVGTMGPEVADTGVQAESSMAKQWGGVPGRAWSSAGAESDICSCKSVRNAVRGSEGARGQEALGGRPGSSSGCVTEESLVLGKCALAWEEGVPFPGGGFPGNPERGVAFWWTC